MNNLNDLNDLNINNIDSNISIVISSCLCNQGKFSCLMKVVKNLNYFLPNSEIIIGFDKVGPNEFQKIELDEYINTSYFTHNKGLGFSFNEGVKKSKQNIILQTEDDWIINNKYLQTKEDFMIILFKCCKLLNTHNTACIKLDGGMFDEIGGFNGYPLGWTKHNYGDIIYYQYNLPTKEDMDKNGWLHYAFSNHPHLKLKNTVITHPYSENVDPGIVENSYSTDWILRLNPIFYVPINEESIKICGATNPDKNIFKHIGYLYSYRTKN